MIGTIELQFFAVLSVNVVLCHDTMKQTRSRVVGAVHDTFFDQEVCMTLSLFICSVDNETSSLRKESTAHRKLHKGTHVCLSAVLTYSKVAGESMAKYRMRLDIGHEECISDGTTACEDIG